MDGGLEIHPTPVKDNTPFFRQFDDQVGDRFFGRCALSE